MCNFSLPSSICFYAFLADTIANKSKSGKNSTECTKMVTKQGIIQTKEKKIPVRNTYLKLLSDDELEILEILSKKAIIEDRKNAVDATNRRKVIA